MDRRIIEELLPLSDIIKNAKEETDKKVNVIKSLHNWWGRKTLSSSRTIIYSSFSNDQI